MEIENVKRKMHDLFFFEKKKKEISSIRKWDRLNLTFREDALYNYFSAPNPALVLLARHVCLCHYIFQIKHLYPSSGDILFS